MKRSLSLLTLILTTLGTVPSDAQPPESEAERWDRRYDREAYIYGKEPVAFLRQQIDRLGSGKALDLAMGEGRNAVFLAEQGFDVTGVDISKVAIAKAERLAAERGTHLQGVVADLGSYELGEERYHLITNFYYLDRELFPKIIAALAPGGIFILETFSTDHLTKGSGFGPKDPAFLLAANEALAAFSSLRILFYEDRLIDVDEGMHHGKAAVIRLIAQKPPRPAGE
jgi:tellurite methyltransferase